MHQMAKNGNLFVNYWNTSRIKALNGMIKWKSKPKSWSKVEVSGLHSVSASVIFLKQADK